VKDKKFRNNQ